MKLKNYDKLTLEDLYKIERMINAGITIKEVLKEININQKTLDKIFENGFTSVILSKQKQNNNNKNN